MMEWGREVDVAQHIRFRLKILQPALDDVADAHDADELALPDDRKMPDPVLGHEAHGAFDAVVWRDRNDCPVRRGLYRQRKRRLSKFRDSSHYFTLGDDAGDGVTGL